MWPAMPTPDGKQWGRLRLFDPRKGVTIREPLGSGPGWWAGASSCARERTTGFFFMYYRLRKPRELGRGAECRIAASADGVHFEDVWSATREQIGTASMEKSALVQGDDGTWRLYLSYVDPEDSRWRIDLLEADDPRRFDARSRQPVLTGPAIGAEGAKDPVVLILGGVYYMLVSYARPAAGLGPDQTDRLHATADVFNTGLTLSATGLALSGDGRRFEWQGEVFGPTPSGWDRYCARISTLVYLPPVFAFFYDGSASVEGNYEERCGLGMSLDLVRFHRASADQPILTSPHSSGSLRYVDAVRDGERLLLYYEYARPDGSHELRVSLVAF